MPVETANLHVVLPREVRERARIQQERDGYARVHHWVAHVLNEYCDGKGTPEVMLRIQAATSGTPKEKKA